MSLFLQNQAAQKNLLVLKAITKLPGNGIAESVIFCNLHQKAEFSGFKALKMISKVRWHPKFNLGQFNA